MLFPILIIFVALSAYITSSYLLIPLLNINIIDAVANLISIPFINKIDIIFIFYLNVSIILLFFMPFTKSFTIIITISIIISTFIIKIKSIYYPPPN